MTPDDLDLRQRFQRLRDTEPEAPAFGVVLAAARQREREGGKFRLVLLPAPLAAAAVVALLASVWISSTKDPASLSKWPVLLPPANHDTGLFSPRLVVETALPSDRLMPLHLQFRL